MMLNTFKYAGIGSGLDGKKDHQFRGDEVQEKGTKLWS